MEAGLLVGTNSYQFIIMSHAFSLTKTSKFQAPFPPTTPRTPSLPKPVLALAMPHNRTPKRASSSVAARNRNSVSPSAREAALNHIQSSADLDSALARFGWILNASDLNIILRNFGNSSRWKDLSQLFEWMQKHGKINPASYSSYIKFMAEGNNTSNALIAYQSINNEAMKNNISICNSILSFLVKGNNFDKAINLFEQMKRSGMQPDGVTYCTLLAGCMKVEYGYKKALELVEELDENGTLMDNVTYGALIAVCASNRQCKDAEMFFNRMKAEGYSPNMYHYSSLLNAYSANGDYEKADVLIQDMKTAKLVPNKVVLTTLLKVYVRGGLLEKSRSFLSELEVLGYAGDEIPYCLVMDGFSKSGKVDEAKLVFDEMNKRQVRSDGYSHSIMIIAFCRVGRLEEAKKLAMDYEAIYNKYDLVIMNTLLCAYCRVSDMGSVMRTLRKMDKLTIDPDQSTFRILIKYFCKEKLYLLAYRTLQDMSSKGYHAEEGILFSLIHNLGRIGAHLEAFSVYKISVVGEAKICRTLHEKILHILIAGQLLEDAYLIIKDNAKLISPGAVRKFLTALMSSANASSINDVLENIHSAGCKIDQDVFHLAILRYIAQPEKKELLLELLQWMLSHGYVVDSSTRTLILKNSNLYGHRFIAEMLSKQHAV